MSFAEAVRSVYGNYAKFDGRAGRAEYWWFQLFVVLVSFGLLFGGIFLIGITRSFGLGALLLIPALIFFLASFIPTLAVSVRRLHDTDKSGWWYLITLVPYVGGLVLLIFMILPGTHGNNRYGPQPGGAADEHIATYSGWSQDDALAKFAADRQHAAAYGYFPVWQTWRSSAQAGVEVLDVMYSRHSGQMPWGGPPPPPWGQSG